MKSFSLFAVVGACLCAGVLSSCLLKTQAPARVEVAPHKAPLVSKPTPLPRIVPAALRGKIMPGVYVLCYHRIDEKPAQYTVLSPADFKAQMAFLQTHEYHVVPLTAIVDALQYGLQLPPKTVALTFDDGFKDNYTVAYPLLKAYHYPATLFIYPHYISNGGAALSWDQLREMAANPLITVESHTLTHPNLAILKRHMNAADYAVRLQKEMRQSRALLQQKLGIETQFLAYPYGIYNDQALNATRAAGYRAAFKIGTAPLRFAGAQKNEMWKIPRIMVKRGEPLAVWASRLQTLKPGAPKQIKHAR